jgi:hypothetical protein
MKRSHFLRPLRGVMRSSAPAPMRRPRRTRNSSVDRPGSTTARRSSAAASSARTSCSTTPVSDARAPRHGHVFGRRRWAVGTDRGRCPAHRACPAITGDYRGLPLFQPARPKSGDPRPRLRIASSTPESPKSSSHRASRAMARPGLEPGTPRFSDVRSTASNGVAIPGKQRVLGRWTQRLKPRSLRSFAAGSGDEVRLVSRSRRCSADDRCVRVVLTGPKRGWYRLSESATTVDLYCAPSGRPLMIPRRPTGAHTRGPANDVACQCRGGGIRRDRWRHRKTGSVAAAARHAGA